MSSPNAAKRSIAAERRLSFRRPSGRRSMPCRISATVIAVVPNSSARRPVTHCLTPASGSGRINSDRTLVSRIIIGKLNWSRSGSPWRQGKLDSAYLAETVHEPLGQVGSAVRLTNRVYQDRADLGLHGPTVPRGPDTEQLHDPVVQVSDAHRRHHDHPFLLSMLASMRLAG